MIVAMLEGKRDCDEGALVGYGGHLFFFAHRWLARNFKLFESWRACTLEDGNDKCDCWTNKTSKMILGVPGVVVRK
jgi:hypothetical protein